MFLLFIHIKMTELKEPVEQIDIDLLREEQNIQNLLDDFDFFVEHLDEEEKKGNYIIFDEEDKKWHVYYHYINEENDCYADERIALEHLFDHVRAVEHQEFLDNNPGIPF